MQAIFVCAFFAPPKKTINMANIEHISSTILPQEYPHWRDEIISLIERSKLQAVLNVNKEMLALYWSIGNDILRQQKELGWGTQVIKQLSHDLHYRFPEDDGYSERNLGYMKQFAMEYPDFPFLQVPLAELEKDEFWQVALAENNNRPILQVPLAKLEKDGQTFVQVPLAQITWYHHISLLPKVKSLSDRAFYIMETAAQGWSRDIMLANIAAGYMANKGKVIANFAGTLPPVDSDFARYAFKDPYTFSFLGTQKLKNEHDVEENLTAHVAEFLMEMGRGFAFVGRQYRIMVDGELSKIDLLMYHLKMHRYVVIELKAVEFVPEFIGKLNFYISAVDEYVRTPEDNPTIGLLLCPTKSNEKVRFSLRGVTQPIGVAEYEIKQLIDEVQSALPIVEEDKFQGRNLRP